MKKKFWAREQKLSKRGNPKYHTLNTHRHHAGTR